MRVNGFHVHRYGPLSEFSIRDAPAFTLFYGPNEQGKTLLVDAMLRLLFKKDLKKRGLKLFGNIKRVSEEPEGFVVVEREGREHKLESSETIPQYFPVPITPEDFRNVFMIRDSDLSVSNEESYYTKVTEKLTGTRMAEIRKLMEKIGEKGRLTSARSDAKLSDSAEFEKIAGKVERAEELVSDITTLKARLARERFDELEKSLAQARERLADTINSRELQKRAEKRERLEKASRNLEELSKTVEVLSRMERIREEDLRQWQEAEWDNKQTKEVLIDDSARLEEERNQIEEKKQAVKSLGSRRDTLKETQGAITEKLEPKIQEYRRDQEKIAGASTREGAFRWWRNASLAVLFVTLAGSIISHSPFLWIAGAIALTGTLIFGGKVLSIDRAKGRMAAAFEALRLDASELGIKAGGSLDDLLCAVGEFKKEAEIAQRDFEKAKLEEDALGKEMERIGVGIEHHKETLRAIEDSIRSFREASGIGNIEDFQKAIQDKREKESKKSSLEAVLANELGIPGTGESAVAEWRKAVTKSIGIEDTPESVSFDPQAVEALEREIESLECKIGELEGMLRAGNEDILKIQSKVNTANLPIEKPDAHRTTAALEALESDLRDFCSLARENADNAREALCILERIEEEEKRRVSSLFGVGAAVSRYFAEVTENRYTEVDYDAESSKINVLLPDGTRLDTLCLSGGAFDQLYLAIRLSIGEQFLQGEKGFFILDDPFIKSDFERLKRQLQMLVRLSESGWQVLYFTAKNEVLEALEGPRTTGIKLVNLGELVASESE